MEKFGGPAAGTGWDLRRLHVVLGVYCMIPLVATRCRLCPVLPDLVFESVALWGSKSYRKFGFFA